MRNRSIERKFIQEKATELFFNHEGQPIVEREGAWLFDEHQALDAILNHYGGPHGADLVTLTLPSRTAFLSWRGRAGGIIRSAKKTRAVQKNAKQPRPSRRKPVTTTTNDQE